MRTSNSSILDTAVVKMVVAINIYLPRPASLSRLEGGASSSPVTDVEARRASVVTLIRPSHPLRLTPVRSAKKKREIRNSRCQAYDGGGRVGRG